MGMIIEVYSKEEQETVLVYNKADKVWYVYSCVPKHIRKFLRIGKMDITESENGRPIAIKGVVQESNISIRKQRSKSEKQEEKDGDE